MIYGVLAALLFGATAPVCKLLLEGASPLGLASLLYLGSGAGLLSWFLLRRALLRIPASPPPRGREWGTLALSALCGSLLAPVLLLAGLARTPASSASLLLNLELASTVLLAWLVFREGFERRVGFGVGILLLGCLVLAWPQRWAWEGLAGPGLIAGACLLWGLDNNLTQGLAERDPALVAGLKGLAGGGTNAVLAVLAGQSFPTGWSLGAALGTGFLGYGVSLACFVLSLRTLGTARTASLFALAPFVGAGLSVALLGDPLSARFLAGLGLVAAGLAFAVGLRHEHPHDHAAEEHDHLHHHDAHHRHDHGEPRGEGAHHSHPHRHDPLTHIHPHMPNTHHRHGHPR